MKPTACTRQQQTLRFLQGRDFDPLSSEEWETINDHISACDSCKQLVDEYPTNNHSLIAEMRNALLQQSIRYPADGSMDASLAGEKGDNYSVSSNPVASIGRYQVINQYQPGGMGVVYRVYDPKMNKELALKMVLDSSRSDHFLALFDQEIAQLGQLKHEFIVPIYHCDQVDGKPYFTMAIASLGSLANHLERFRGDSRATVQMMAKVARAIHYVHEHHIIHRDLKPGNILLDDNDKPLVSDFGLALLDQGNSSQSMRGGGTLPYMAPEQISGLGEITPRTDIWALGVILYEILVGQRPFQAAKPLTRDRKTYEQLICRTEPERPCKIQPRLSRHLETILLCCLTKNPAERYPTAAALATDLERWLQGEPPMGDRLPFSTQIGRWMQRHPVTMTMLAAVLVGFLLTGAGCLVVREINDPKRPIRLMQSDLKQGKTVNLLEKNRPRATHWPLEEGRFHRNYPTPDMVTYESKERLAVLEILPEIPASAYRFQAEIRHDTGPEGYVGLALFLTKLQHPLGPFVAFASVEFNDLEKRDTTTNQNPLCVYVNCTRNFDIGLAQDRMGRRAQLLNLLTFEPGLLNLGKGPWRTISVVVTSRTLTVSFENRMKQSFDIQKEIVEQMQTDFDLENNAAGMVPIQIGSGLGLFCSQALVSFRNVTVQPIELKDVR